MRLVQSAALLAAGALAGCMAGGAPLTAQTPSSPPPQLGSPFSDQRLGLNYPLVLDRTDLQIGTTVEFSRIPTASELHDLRVLPGLAHILMVLPSWPSSYEPLQVLSQAPQESDLIVILPGYPPTREAAAAWNLVTTRLRMVLVVNGPPAKPGVLDDLNLLRGLERVIAQMDSPSRSGFERLQRPLSFRKIVE